MIEKVLKTLNKEEKYYAVFDCDETLIKGDIERAMWQYMLEEKAYRISMDEMKKVFIEKGIPKEKLDNFDMNKDFRELTTEVYAKTGYSMTSTLLKGFTEEEVFELATKASKYVEKREGVQELIDLLRRYDVEVYICSASQKSEVMVVANWFGVPSSNVIAAEQEHDKEGRITGVEIPDEPRNFGKVKRIESLGYKTRPVVIAGDSDGDYPMMTRLNPMIGLIIAPKDNTKIKCLVDNVTFYEVL